MSDQNPSESNNTSPAAESPVKTGEWLKSGFDLYKNNLVLLIVTGLITGVIAALSFGILAGPMFVGYMLIILRLIDKTEPTPTIGDVFKGFPYFLQSLLFFIAVVVCNIIISLVLEFVPGVGSALSTFGSLALGTLFMFGIPLIADKGLDMLPALKLSCETVAKNFFPFLVFSVVANVVGLSGAILLGFGIILTMPIYICCVGIAYRETF